MCGGVAHLKTPFRKSIHSSTTFSLETYMMWCGGGGGGSGSGSSGGADLLCVGFMEDLLLVSCIKKAS